MTPLFTLGALLLLAGSQSARPNPTPLSFQPDSTDVARVETYDGTLTITRITNGGEWEFHVRVDSVLLLRDDVAERVSLHTITAWSGGLAALLEVSSGGSACPSMYRIVEFAEGSRPTVTEEFGDCSDIPLVLLDGTRFRVRFPGFYHGRMAREPGFRPPPPITWELVGKGRMRKKAGTGAEGR
jgi:hypothetical protein